MANRVLTIVAKVKDAASAGLNQIQNSLKKTGTAANQTSTDFTKFNKVMFSTTAYVGLFQRAFSNFGDSLLKGAEFDRITSQFERVMGPKGELFDSIAGFTDNSIDKVEALRAAIQMKSLGITSGMADSAELIARAGTAAKLAGMDSGEGIRHFTAFLKDGSIANLEFLNLIRSADPALKIQMGLIEKMGGVLGSAINSQMKYNLGLRLLRMATDGAMKGQRDLYDVVFDVKQSFTLLKNEVGIFLGTSLSSLIDKVTHAVDKFSLFLENIRNTKKEILFLTKAFVVVAGALAGFMATFGTLRLAAIALSALGISVTPLIYGVATLLTVFTALTYKVKEGSTPLERFTEKLRVFAGVVKGVWQLVSSYIGSQDNMRKGIGQIDRDLYELLNKNGLFVFVQRTAKTIAVLARFGIAVFKQLVTWAQQLDEIFGRLGNKFSEFFGVNQKLSVNLDATGNKVDEPHIKRMSDLWVNANGKAYGFMKKAAAALIVAFTFAKILGIGKGFLSNLPLIGKYFKSGKPDGTKSNPLHVLLDNAIIDKIFGAKILGPVMKGAPALGREGGLLVRFVEMFTGALGEAFAALGTFAGSLTLFEGFSVVRIAVSAIGFLVGSIEGLIDNFSSFSDTAGSIYDYVRSLNISELIMSVIDSIKNAIVEGLTNAFNLIAPYIQIILKPLEKVFNIFAGWIDTATIALKALYDRIMEIPGVKQLVEATISSVLHPYDTFKNAAYEGTGALAAGAGMVGDMARNATAKNFLDQADKTGTLPFIPTNAEDRADYVNRAIDQANAADRDRMVSAMKEAQKASSEDGTNISANEFARIFGIAVAPIVKHTKETATETKKGNQEKTMKSRRGGC